MIADAALPIHVRDRTLTPCPAPQSAYVNERPSTDLESERQLSAGCRGDGMAQRVMYVPLKTGHHSDRGPAWISWVDFPRTWNSANFDGHTLHRAQGISRNFVDTDTGEEYWLSAPKQDWTDGRYSNLQ